MAFMESGESKESRSDSKGELTPADSFPSDKSSAPAPAASPHEVYSNEDEPDELIVRVTDDRAIVLAPPGHEHNSRWGRFIAVVTVPELRGLLLNLDPVARAVIETKRLSGALVELHPADREMFTRGFTAVREGGGWLQANFRDHGRVARLMRIRPATGVALMSGGALALAAIATQAQAADMTRSIEAIGQVVNELEQYLHDDQMAEVDSAIEQVEELVQMLRTHGKAGVSKADIAVVRKALGDARHKCIQHLKSAVRDLESLTQPSAHEVEQLLSQQVVDEVTVYLNQLVQLEEAEVQFGLVRVSRDCHRRKPEIAKTRADQVRKSVDAHRNEISELCERLTRLGGTLPAEIDLSFGGAARRIAKSALQGAAAGASGGLVIALGPPAAEAIKGGDVDEDNAGDNETTGPHAVAAATFGAAVGLVGGGGWGAKNVIQDLRAKKPAQERLAQLVAASSRTLGTAEATSAALEWLHVVTEELVQPPAMSNELARKGEPDHIR